MVNAQQILTIKGKMGMYNSIFIYFSFIIKCKFIDTLLQVLKFLQIYGLVVDTDHRLVYVPS